MKYLTVVRSALLAPAQSDVVGQAISNGRLTTRCTLALLFVLLLLFVGINTLQANTDVGIKVITNKDVYMRSVDDTEIRRLFLGKSRRLPNGDRAALAAYAPSRTFFNSRVLGQSDTDVARIWSKLRFSGRQAPPITFNTVEEVVAYVKSTPNALAYIPSTYRGDDVRVMTSIPGNAPSLLR